jgi:uncharacterized protein with GYD domain
MTTFLMFGKYSSDSINKISPQRTKDAEALVEKNGGKVVGGYALLGDTDLLLIVEFEGVEQAMKTSVGLSQLLGIGFKTSPAVSVEEFDRLTM